MRLPLVGLEGMVPFSKWRSSSSLYTLSPTIRDLLSIALSIHYLGSLLSIFIHFVVTSDILIVYVEEPSSFSVKVLVYVLKLIYFSIVFYLQKLTQLLERNLTMLRTTLGCKFTNLNI